MPAMNEFLATGPFDLYELQLFQLVAEHQSFTKAARVAGLTQSAITRQISGMEHRLGVTLFERTTRSVRLTAAGAALHARSGAILSGVNDAITAVQEKFDLLPQTLRVGVSRTIGLAYLPGFFTRFTKNRRRHGYTSLTRQVPLFLQRWKAASWTQGSSRRRRNSHAHLRQHTDSQTNLHSLLLRTLPVSQKLFRHPPSQLCFQMKDGC